MKSKQPLNREHKSRRPDPAVEETMRLCHAWLGYLLARLGEDEIRVPVEDISRALDTVGCDVAKEDGVYVIRIRYKGGEVMPHEAPIDVDTVDVTHDTAGADPLATSVCDRE